MATMKACIFDMDGVIVDSAKYHFLAWQRLAEELSIDFDHHDNEALKGLSRVDSLERILIKGGLLLDNNTKEVLMEKKNKWYLEFISDMRPEEVLPGVKEFLVMLKEEGVKIGLGSSSKNAQMILDKTKLAPFFDVVVDGNQVTFSKPDPEVFINGARQLNVLPSEVVVFEDAEAGVDAALSGGFHVIGVGDVNVLSKAEGVIRTFEGLTPSDVRTMLNL
ncbi:MAG: beta-phosphoglucomutase [Cryomorphaceae bacterium]|nr:beta-phosphoglucomutase [Cryomorphaceae bacterium]